MLVFQHLYLLVEGISARAMCMNETRKYMLKHNVIALCLDNLRETEDVPRTV